MKNERVFILAGEYINKVRRSSARVVLRLLIFPESGSIHETQRRHTGKHNVAVMNT
jgi:hypothetical protein